MGSWEIISQIVFGNTLLVAAGRLGLRVVLSEHVEAGRFASDGETVWASTEWDARRGIVHALNMRKHIDSKAA